jgi:hypothetical protein
MDRGIQKGTVNDTHDLIKIIVWEINGIANSKIFNLNSLPFMLNLTNASLDPCNDLALAT